MLSVSSGPVFIERRRVYLGLKPLIPQKSFQKFPPTQTSGGRRDKVEIMMLFSDKCGFGALHED